MKRLASAAAFFALLLVAAQPADATKGVVVDKAKRSVTVDAKVAPRKLEHLKGEVYPIELIASWPHPRGKKAHETVVTIDAEPSAVHKGLEEIGLKPGKPAKGEGAVAEGPEVNVFIDVPDPAGTRRLTMDKVLLDPKTKKPLPKGVKFRFTGSVMSAADPNKPDDKKYGADLSGTLIALFPVTDETVLQTSLTMKEEKYLKLDVNPDVLPKEGTPVKLVIEAAPTP
ncbi:MAG: YdjY domain-containing protein [Gemmataceae bacterium]|nr:YdjY domain-containing protein [Gemmataceae bacterium]